MLPLICFYHAETHRHALARRAASPMLASKPAGAAGCDRGGSP